MKRSIVVSLLSLLLAAVSYGQIGIHPNPGTDIQPAIPAACTTPSTWAAAAVCLDAIVNTQSHIFPGAVIAYQQDGQPAKIYAKGTGFTTSSVVSLASVSKPMTYAALVKLVQDHYASPACTPMTASCVFPQKFQTPLLTALTRLDTLRGTTVVDDWFNRIAFDDPSGTQAAWKQQITIQHLAQMTSGFPPMTFTGQVYCTGSVCPETMQHDVTCNLNDPDPAAAAKCRQARLYNQYLARRGPAIPNGCRPRPASGPRVFDFGTYYNGQVDASYRLIRQFERRWSYQPFLTGECMLLESSQGSSWVDSRTMRESDVAKFFLGMPLLSQPGTQYDYSQPNVYVTALLIESLSGQRFDEYLDAKFFTPLNMTDTSFVIYPGSTQHQRLVDIKRIPTTPARTLPDTASPVRLNMSHGVDKNWDELRGGWENRAPEGGASSTAGDLLRFLNFVRTGKTPNGQVILNAESLALITAERDSTPGVRNYAFRNSEPGVLSANGYFATLMRRNKTQCTNLAVLPQIITENPELDVQLADCQYGDVTGLRQALVHMIEGIPATCAP
jgi:CubicO group peptidase (beta-lactamase class C family)